MKTPATTIITTIFVCDQVSVSEQVKENRNNFCYKKRKLFFNQNLSPHYRFLYARVKKAGYRWFDRLIFNFKWNYQNKTIIRISASINYSFD